MPIEIIYRNDHCEWIDVEAPTPEDLLFLHERYKINQSKTNTKNQTVDITYNPYDGNPVRILKDGKDLITKI